MARSLPTKHRAGRAQTRLGPLDLVLAAQLAGCHKRIAPDSGRICCRSVHTYDADGHTHDDTDLVTGRFRDY